tara:strand:+ start:6266 stop:6646 length:381 start_codon:yes stop_codon:yes gene_type:complete
MQSIAKVVALSFLFSHAAHAVDASITTFGSKKVHELKNISILCDGKNTNGNMVISQDGANLEIPLSSIRLLRTLQHPTGFFIKTLSGKEMTHNKMSCSDYQWVGENEFGGSTSIGGTKWRQLLIQG